MLLALLAFSATAAPSIADEQYKTTIVAAPGSPVNLTKCEAWARDFNKRSLGMAEVVPDFYLDLGVGFTNVSAKPIKAVMFDFTAYDAFNAIVSEAQLSTGQARAGDRVSMDAGAAVDLMGPRGWQSLNAKNGKDHVSCAVGKVAFADGSTWSAPASPAPTSTP